MAYNRPYYENTDTVEGFCEAVKGALQFWLDVHTNADAWAWYWLVDCEASYTFNNCNGKLKNDYFSFDWKTAAYKHLAAAACWERCPECGIMDEYIYCDCDAEAEQVDDEETAEMLAEYESPLPEWILEKALVEEGFAAYREALKPVTSGVEEEITECLEAIDAAANNYDRLQATLWATRIYHINGNLTSDYCNDVGLDYDLVDDVRNNGLDSRFDRDEIREFITT